MLIVFDCDGTLVDSQANIIRAMQETFVRANLVAPSHHAIRRVVGLSLVETMQHLVPEATAEQHIALANEYKDAFQILRGEQQLVAEPMFSGLRQLLAELHSRQISLAVATGKSDRGLRLCLDHHGLSAYFTSLQTADRHPSKPDPSMLLAAMRDCGEQADQTLMIGDTSFDMAMAINAGVCAIGVDWGYHDRDELLAHGAAHVADDADHLRALIETMLS